MSADYLSIKFENVPKLKEQECKTNRILPFANSSVYYTSINSYEQLSRGDNVNTVYDAALNLEGIHYKFEPGDTIGILPCNNKEETDELLDRLKLTSFASATYHLSILKETTKKKPTLPVHVPVHGTLYELFLKHLDIRSVPKKLFLKTLARYTTEATEIEELSFLSSSHGSKDYINFVTKNNTLLKLLKHFPSCLPPVERLLEHLPPLQPRPYSISSTALVNETELHITFSIVKNGVCSSWLENIIRSKSDNSSDIVTNFKKFGITSQCVPFYFRKSNDFRLPSDLSTPIIMIAAGTGIAPFIGFLLHRNILLKQETSVGLSWLFYGCRYSERDFLYKDKIQEFLENGTLSKLFTAFSRENCNKVYVQHVMKKHGESLVNQIVNEGAVIYICGAKTMAQEVKQSLILCLTEFNQMTEVEATNYCKNLIQTKKYIQDLWI